VFLRDDPPAGVLDELRWHLGIADERPHAYVIDDEPQPRPNPDSRLPGGEFTALRRQPLHVQHSVLHHAWGLHARLLWLDDTWAEVLHQVVRLLAPHVERDGYAGFFREEEAGYPTLLLFQDGEPSLGEY
jgi:hypothetical protein